MIKITLSEMRISIDWVSNNLNFDDYIIEEAAIEYLIAKS